MLVKRTKWNSGKSNREASQMEHDLIQQHLKDDPKLRQYIQEVATEGLSEKGEVVEVTHTSIHLIPNMEYLRANPQKFKWNKVHIQDGRLKGGDNHIADIGGVLKNGKGLWAELKIQLPNMRSTWFACNWEQIERIEIDVVAYIKNANLGADILKNTRKSYEEVDRLISRIVSDGDTFVLPIGTPITVECASGEKIDSTTKNIWEVKRMDIFHEVYRAAWTEAELQSRLNAAKENYQKKVGDPSAQKFGAFFSTPKEPTRDDFSEFLNPMLDFKLGKNSDYGINFLNIIDRHHHVALMPYIKSYKGRTFNKILIKKKDWVKLLKHSALASEAA